MEIISAKFIKSASKLEECPESTYPEYAFIGRSNVGKSSLINMITQKKNLAKASVTPGKTQLLNYFLINDSRYLVDLPWYGYAKYSRNQRVEWMDTMQEFLTNRENIKKVFVLVDWSIEPQKIDLEFIQVLFEENINFAIVVTKTDKINQSTLYKNILAIKDSIQKQLWFLPEIFLTSSEKGRGRKELLNFLEW